MYKNCVVIASLMVAAASAQLPSPALTNVYPAGGTRGLKQDITISGRDLDGASRLVFSHPGISGKVKMQAATEFQAAKPIANQFEVTIADNVPLGMHEVKAIGRFGVSSVMPFMVHLESSVLESGSNQKLESATPITIDSVVYGRADANAKNFFRFAGKKDQRIHIECFCAELDSSLEPIVALMDNTGKVLKRNRSPKEPGFGFKLPSGGDYLLSVHDHIYGGGATHVYGLRLSSAARIEFVLPAAGLPNSTSEFTLYGSNLPGGTDSTYELNGVPLQQKKVNVFVPAADDIAVQVGQLGPAVLEDSFSYQLLTTSGASNHVSIGLANATPIVEQEPNDHTKPQAVSIPFDLSGTFYPRRDQDWVRFSAKKGQTLSIRLISNRLGIKSDPSIHVWQVVKDGKGKETFKNLQATDDAKYDKGRFTRRIPRGLDTKNNDPELTFKVPADGDYGISVRDLFGNARNYPKSVYRLVVSEPQSDFELIAWSQRFRRDGNNVRLERGSSVLRAGETIAIPVDVVRTGGFSGDVVVSAKGLPASIRCDAITLKGSQTEGILFLSATNDAKAWTGPIEISGTSTVSGNAVKKTARFTTVSSDSTNLASKQSSSRTTQQLVVSVVGDDKVAAAVGFEKPKYETSLGGVVKLKLNYIKNDKMKGDLTLKTIGLPGQVKVGDIKLKPNANDATIEVKVTDAKTPPGKYNVYLNGQVVAVHPRDAHAIKLAEQAKSEFDKTFAELDAIEKERTKQTAESKAALEQLKNQLAQLDTEKAKHVSGQAAASRELELAKQALASATEANQSSEEIKYRNSAVTAASEKITQLTAQVEQQQKKRAELETNLKKGTEQLAATEKLAKDAAEKKKRAEAHKKALTDQLNSAKKNNAPKDVPVVLISPSIEVEIKRSPVNMMLANDKPQVEAAKGAAAEVLIDLQVERKYGFADAVDFEVVPAKNSGLKADALKLAKDATSGKLKINVSPQTKAGQHKIQLKSKLKFGGVDIVEATDLVLTVTRK